MLIPVPVLDVGPMRRAERPIDMDPSTPTTPKHTHGARSTHNPRTNEHTANKTTQQHHHDLDYLNNHQHDNIHHPTAPPSTTLVLLFSSSLFVIDTHFWSRLASSLSCRPTSNQTSNLRRRQLLSVSASLMTFTTNNNVHNNTTSTTTQRPQQRNRAVTQHHSPTFAWPFDSFSFVVVDVCIAIAVLCFRVAWSLCFAWSLCVCVCALRGLCVCFAWSLCGL